MSLWIQWIGREFCGSGSLRQRMRLGDQQLVGCVVIASVGCM